MHRRRWLQFSLSSVFLLVTVFGVWLGIVVNQARKQREGVAAIEAAGGVVFYDWQDPPLDPFADPIRKPPGPSWLRRFIGDDFFQKVNIVSFRYMQEKKTTDILNLIPHLQRLGGLEAVFVSAKTSQSTVDKLRAALPKCDEVTVDLSGF